MNGLIQMEEFSTSTNVTQINAYADAQLISSNGSNNYFEQSAWGIALNFEFTNKINAMDSSSNAAIVAGLNGVDYNSLGKTLNIHNIPIILFSANRNSINFRFFSIFTTKYQVTFNPHKSTDRELGHNHLNFTFIKLEANQIRGYILCME